jgi:predicted RNA binding protein YcfA (HicA-like mRNA interferase family)
LSRLPKATGKEILAALQREGFLLTHVRGSHHYLRKAGIGGLVVVPVHGNRTLPVGTLRSILRQAGLAPEDLEALL